MVDAVELAGNATFADAVLVGVVLQGLGQAGLPGATQDRLKRRVGVGELVVEPRTGVRVFFEVFAGPQAVFEDDLRAPLAAKLERLGGSSYGSPPATRT